jgi:competence protein ComEA
VKERDMPKSIYILLSLIFSPVLWAGPVDVNSADAETIARELEGIGSARARAIVEYRQEFGKFASVDDLLNVAGIGERILDANRANIVIEE